MRDHRYVIYIPSKGRHKHGDAPTFGVLDRDQLAYKAVVEPQEADIYREWLGEEHVLELPFRDLGQGSIPARNWIKQYSIERGETRHWQLDDNIKVFRRLYKGQRIPCHAGLALRVCEDFSDRYTNVAVSGLNYQMFVPSDTPSPYYLNAHVYSCTLVNNSIPHGWRGRYNEDTDLCLQVLADGWCTVLLNVFMADKMKTMQAGGGNTDELYVGDGRIKMARALERQWPGVVHVDRRWQRPAHVIHSNWRKFDTPLKRREDIDFDALPEVDEYGAELNVKREIKSPEVQQLLMDWDAE